MITLSASVYDKCLAKMSRFGTAAALLCLSAAVHAESYLVTLNTSGLNQSDSYGIDLQLNQGAPNNPVSTVTASNVSFTGGGSLDTNPSDLYTSGGVSGILNATNGVTLTTSAAPYNEFTQNFIQTFAPGSSVSFNVNASGLTAPAGNSPDEFIVDLYDNTAGTPVTTTNASGNSSPAGFELFTITPSAGGNATQTYGYTGPNGFDGTHSLVNGGSAVPEPASPALLSLGLLPFGLIVVRRRRAA